MIIEPREVALGPFSDSEAVVTSWDVAADALRRTPKFWLSTVRPDGRPHVAPLLAVMALDGLCIATGPTERKSKNMHANPHVVITTGTNTLTGIDFVIEGIATLRSDVSELHSVADTFEGDLGWHLTDPAGNWHGMGDAIRAGEVQTWKITPSRGFANSDGKYFSQTRYVW